MNGWSGFAILLAFLAIVGIVLGCVVGANQAQHNGIERQVACTDAGGSYIDQTSDCLIGLK